MAGRLSPLGIVTKWLLVPGILAVVGYFIVGPRIGDKVNLGKGKEQAPPAATTGTQTASITDTRPAKTFTAPEVDVSVTPAANTAPKKKKRRRKKKKPPVTVTTPDAPATTPTAPPADLPPVGRNDG